MNEIHVMNDIETMCFGSNSAIIEIAAVQFDINTGEQIDSFHNRINLQSCIDAGLRVNGETILWWMLQDDESRHRIALQENSYSISEALNNFQYWLNQFGGEQFMWGRSPRFDLGIIYDAYRIVLGYQHPPWNIRKERCVRTYESLRPEVLKEVPVNSSKHDPIADCLHQISYISKIHNLLKL